MLILKKENKSYSFEREVALGDHFSELGDDKALCVRQFDPLHSHVHLTGFAVLPGLLSLNTKGIIHIIYIDSTKRKGLLQVIDLRVEAIKRTDIDTSSSWIKV